MLEKTTTFWTRANWSTNVIDVTNFCTGKDDLKIELSFVANDKVDFVGLDTSEEDECETQQAYLLAALNLPLRDCRPQLLSQDGIYAQLLPNQHILLVFFLENKCERARTFIFYTYGHYVKE